MRGTFFKWRFEIEAVDVGAEFERALENRGAGSRAKAAVKKWACPIVDDHWVVVELGKFGVNARAEVAVLRELFYFFAKSDFSSEDDGGQGHDAVVRLADFAVQNGLNNLLAGLARDGFAAIRAMRNAHGC